MFDNQDESGQGADTPAENQENNQPDQASGEAQVASAATAPAADDAWQQLDTPAGNDAGASENSQPISPAGGFPNSASSRLQGSGPVLTFEDQTDQDDNSDTAPAANDAAVDSGLVEIKQKALSELAPLLDQLDLPPEEKFHTVMMMIQASDDQSLVEKAYETAHAIEDEKVRAQALLDIVNEINYFTHQPGAEQPEA